MAERSPSDQPTQLAIVGASARAAAFSALRSDFDVVTADLFADADLQRRCPATRIDNYPEGLADWLAEQEVDAWMYTGALENYPELVDRMAEIRPLWGNKGEVLRRCRDPLELWKACNEYDLNFPDTALEPRGLPTDGRWLVKTLRGSNGLGVSSLDGPQAIRDGLTKQAFYQQRVEGTPAAAVFAIDAQGSKLLACTEQLVGCFELHAPRWGYCGSIAWRELAEQFRPTLQRIGEMLATHFRLRGLVGVDLIIADQHLWLIEINPRFTSSMECGMSSAVGSHGSCFAQHRETEENSPSHTPSGKAVLYARQAVVVGREFYRWSLAEADAGRIADVPVEGISIEPGQPVLTVFDYNSGAGTRERLFERIAEVEALLYAL